MNWFMLQRSRPDDPPRASETLALREISRAAAFVALAMLLPPVFHAVRLGHVFLPMVQPLLLGAFFLRPRWALSIGVLTPLLSALTTGMPPLLPPIAVWMSAEVGLMALLVSLLDRRTRLPAPIVVLIALVAGRVLYTALVYVTSAWLTLPAGILTVAAVASSWPGMLIALFVVPAAVVGVRRARSLPRPAHAGPSETP
jgi:hypothetical protein